MKLVISNHSGVDETTFTGNWPLTSTYEPLLETLREAARRAAGQQRSILASFTFPIEWIDPMHVFAAAGRDKSDPYGLTGRDYYYLSPRQGVSAGEGASFYMGERFFWERPAEGNALVGVGAAATIETHGVTRFTDSASAWRALLNDAAITCIPPTDVVASSGPVLFGGYTFDPLAARTELWADFPDGLLILPQILLSYSADCVALTVNRMIQASDDSEQCAQEIAANVRRLQDVVERTPEIRREDTGNAFSLREIRPASEWKAMVASTVDKIQHGAFEKVVLARDIQATLDDSSATFDIGAVLQRLRESYPTAYVFAVQRGERFFVGATPERLVQARDGQIQTMALAGSARRGETEEEDARLGAELLQSGKNKNEHEIVVEMVREALENHCTHVHVSTTPQLLKLKNVQHLKTPIVGELVPGQCILDIMADLHPTPAVGGFPRHTALAAIRDVEKLDRGWYAAPLGWIGASGHGEFAVALRSGLIDGGTARLFAGCGIVADSDPQTEFVESCLKFQAMLHALGYEARDGS
jgi:menaquinone-specific isochorismate synthase